MPALRETSTGNVAPTPEGRSSSILRHRSMRGLCFLSQPADKNDNPAGKANNRRVEFIKK